MPEERLELSRGCPRTILSRVRIPFRHSGLLRQLGERLFTRAFYDKNFYVTITSCPARLTIQFFGLRLKK